MFDDFFGGLVARIIESKCLEREREVGDRD